MDARRVGLYTLALRVLLGLAVSGDLSVVLWGHLLSYIDRV